MHAFGRLCALHMVLWDVEHLYLYPTLHFAVWFHLVSFRFGCGLFHSTLFLFTRLRPLPGQAGFS
jgi:hypothetical protein